MNETEIILKSVKDFFNSRMLKIALIPLIVSMIILYLIFFGMASFGIETLRTIAQTAQEGGEVIIDESSPFYTVWFTYFIVFLFKYSITSWLAGILFYTIGTIFVFHISVILTLFIIGFLTPMIVDNLHKKDYAYLKLKPFGNVANAIINAFKSVFVMILLYILFIPLYFIPIINIIALYLPLYYFFHKLLNFDVGSTILSKDEYKKIYIDNSSSFRFRTLALYFLSTVPFITLFVAVFYVIYLSNAYFMELIKLRKEEEVNFE
ncbi:EI24 domain-containing protein [Aliarcobacter lanthieri]|uniref:EI24 domain-containing protein n=1 Tax=Aliarcobacter lanthieri TaxID=1355374 RepID=UPI003AADE747